MRYVAAIAGIFLIAVILWDGFETIILPRRVTRRVRLTRLFYRCTWIPWSAVARRMKPGKRRETLLSIYGPLSLLLLFFMWAVGLIFSFAFSTGPPGPQRFRSVNRPPFGLTCI